MKRMWKAAALALVLAVAAGCPQPGVKASKDAPYAQKAPQTAPVGE